MDRTPYQLPFSIDHVPHWTCPTCGTGKLILDKASLVKRETTASRKEHSHGDWEPYWERGVFSCVFQCGNEGCGEPVSCCGVSRVETFEYEDDEHGWCQSTEDLFTPNYFHPSLVLVDIPKACPPAVRQHLVESFALFFSDSGAALNCARAAVEALLTDLGVKRFSTGSGKRRTINLHQRLDKLPGKHADLKDQLLAVKWLGNAGSHAGAAVTAADVRLAYDLLEDVLSEVYDDKRQKLKRMAKKVNKKKGPVQ